MLALSRDFGAVFFWLLSFSKGKIGRVLDLHMFLMSSFPCFSVSRAIFFSGDQPLSRMDPVPDDVWPRLFFLTFHIGESNIMDSAGRSCLWLAPSQRAIDSHCWFQSTSLWRNESEEDTGPGVTHISCVPLSTALVPLPSMPALFLRSSISPLGIRPGFWNEESLSLSRPLSGLS